VVIKTRLNKTHFLDETYATGDQLDKWFVIPDYYGMLSIPEMKATREQMYVYFTLFEIAQSELVDGDGLGFNEFWMTIGTKVAKLTNAVHELTQRLVLAGHSELPSFRRAMFTYFLMRDVNDVIYCLVRGVSLRRVEEFIDFVEMIMYFSLLKLRQGCIE
jgi:hypothetical protein